MLRRATINIEDTPLNPIPPDLLGEDPAVEDTLANPPPTSATLPSSADPTAPAPVSSVLSPLKTTTE